MQEYNTLLLEISGESGNLEDYVEAIDLSVTRGISRVLFCSIFDEAEEKGKEIFDDLQEYCKQKEIIVIPKVLGCDEPLYNQPMLTKTDSDLRVRELFSKVIPLKNFKKTIAHEKGLVKK